MTYAEARAFAPAMAARLAPIYWELGWHWVPDGRVPDASEINATFQMLIDKVEAEKIPANNNWSTGGLRVSREDGHIVLSFEWEAWDLPGQTEQG